MTQDQELFELCKEVYKRFPEWKTGRHIWSMKRPVICKGDDFMDCMSFPLYTSDYLLEKLSGLKHTIYLTQGKKWVDGRQVGVWAEAQYSDSINAGDKGDTPLKALLKLVVALDDAGVKL